MEENFVLNGNKLIAEFMGTTYEQKKNTHGMVLYAISWDWLMPVLKKIKVTIEDNKHYNKWYLFQDYCILELEIEEVYLNIIEYITYYNENNKSNKS